MNITSEYVFNNIKLDETRNMKENMVLIRIQL